MERIKLALAVFAIVFAGCSLPSPYTSTGRTYPPLQPGAHVAVYLGEERPAAYEEIGMIECAGGWSRSLGEATEFAKEHARRNGGDILVYKGAREETYSTPDPVFGGHSTGSSTLHRFIVGRTKPQVARANPPAPTLSR